MPVHAEPRPEIDTSNAPSGRSDIDETVAAPPAPGTSAGLGFGPPAADGEVGTLGPYRVVKELGRGGMGAVYAALDTRLDRRLALKVMLPAFAADAAAKGRFLREARAAAKISHNNVVTVYEADERQGVPYIAMQFLEGYPLDEYLKKKGNPTVPQVLRIAAEAASGLAAAHKMGLVHRDIKPGNLWLEAPHGRVKVLDFGLAKPVDAEVELTKSGAIVGTPAYMSPEQARGDKVDHRTDLFSLGALMYRLCTGKLPFHGPTTMAVLMALGTEEPPPVREVNPAVPEALAALIHQLLAKRADARPQSAAEVVKRVRALAAPRGQSADLSTSQPQLVQPPVVYVPMQVTAVAAANPFADLDDPDTEMDSREPVEEPTAAPAPVGKKPGGRWRWPAVGFAALAAVMLGGVIVIIKNKDGTETKIEVPDGATVTVKGKDGKTLASVGPEKKPVVAADPDRKAAETLKEYASLILTSTSGKKFTTRPAAPLPDESFAITRIDFRSDSDFVAPPPPKTVKGILLPAIAELKSVVGITDSYDRAGFDEDDIVRLTELPFAARLTHLPPCPYTPRVREAFGKLPKLKSVAIRAHTMGDADLEALAKELPAGVDIVTFHGLGAGAAVGERGVTAVTGMPLMWLNFRKSPAFDSRFAKAVAGMPKLTNLAVFENQEEGWAAELAASRSLAVLTLHNTPIRDADLESLAKLTSLKHLGLRDTKVTEAGVKKFAADLPGCKIEHDGGSIEPKAAADPDRKAAEWVIVQGGFVHVNGDRTDRKAAADLPRDRFTLTHVNLRGTKVSDAGLAHLKELKGLTLLDLRGTQVSDAGLEHIKELKGLTRLELHGTAVTDAGLAHLKDLKGLTVLYLGGTTVSDAGLEHLKELKGLTYLDLQKTAVTAKGLEAFHTAVPACKIKHDGGTTEPKK